MVQMRKFGQLSQQVSVIGFGGGAISGEGGGYGFGQVSEADSIELVHACLDAGINLFDTAPIYGFGTSEQRLGKALHDRRDQAFIVSKAGVTWDEKKRVRMDNSPDVVNSMLEQSLRDLQTDYIDLYFIHWPSKDTDISEPMRVLADAKKAGKIRAIGLSNTYDADLRKAMEIERVDVVQAEYNLLKRKVEGELFPLVREFGLGFMSWGTLEKGILTGRVTKDRKFDQHDSRSRAPWWTKTDHSAKFAAMDKINRILAEANHSGLELAIGYLLSHNEVSTALCGIKNKDQLKSAVNALENLPSDEVLQACRDVAIEFGL